MPTPGPLPTVLLHFDGASGSTTITDSSANNWPVTVFGNAQLSAADPKFGAAELVLDGTGDYITLPANPAFAIGTNDFTIDFWCKPDVVNDNDGLFTFGGGSSGLFVALFQGSWRVGNLGSGGVVRGPATAGQRVHIAVTRQGTRVRFFLNGSELGSTLFFSNNFTDNQLKIGYYSSTGFPYDGTIDEFRFINGTAIWTSNFTPPAEAYNYSEDPTTVVTPVPSAAISVAALAPLVSIVTPVPSAAITAAALAPSLTVVTPVPSAAITVAALAPLVATGELLALGVAPTVRNFRMDEWPQTVVKMRGGLTVRWAQVNSPDSATLDLTWENITHAQAELLLAAWDANYGIAGSFVLTSETIAGLDPTLAALILAPFPSATWRAQGPPVLESVKARRCTARLPLRTRNKLTFPAPPAVTIPSGGGCHTP